MRITGQQGKVKIAGRTAASLGPWSCDRKKRATRVRVRAKVIEADSFLLTRQPLEISLDTFPSQKAVESIVLDEDSADIVVLW